MLEIKKKYLSEFHSEQQYIRSENVDMIKEMSQQYSNSKKVISLANDLLMTIQNRAKQGNGSRL